MELLRFEHIAKRFGGVTALRDGNLCVNEGEVHLLLGENGAGKSTLMKIVAGIVERDAGRMLWNGNEVFFRSPSEAAAIGIAHGESGVAAGAPPDRGGKYLSRAGGAGASAGSIAARMTERARRLIEQYGFPLQAEWRVDRLSPAGRQWSRSAAPSSTGRAC